MDRIKEKVKRLTKNNKELVIGIIIGLVVSTTAVYAVTYYAANELSYDDTKESRLTLGETDVQGALTKINEEIEENCMKKEVTVTVANGTITGDSTKRIRIGETGTFTVSPNSGYGNGTVSCTNSQTATLSGTTLSITPTAATTCTVTFTKTASWHYSGSFGNAFNCGGVCPGVCSGTYSTSVWSCTNSNRTAPTSASLTNGGSCWCEY